jgi:hypothetical protein
MPLTIRIPGYLVLSVLLGSQMELANVSTTLTIISKLISICLLFVVLASMDHAVTSKSSR